jgi:hypothetical protein
MKSIPILCTALLLASVFAMQLTSPQNSVFYVPAAEGLVKVRPANLTDPAPQVVDLQEADRRHKEIYGTNVTDPYAYDDSDCLFGSCGLEIELTMAKLYLLSFIKG